MLFWRCRALTLASKDMNISVKDTTVFAVFHPDAQDLYNTCSDLKKVAWGLWDPTRRLGNEVRCPNPRSTSPLQFEGQKGTPIPSVRSYALQATYETRR